MKSKKTGSLGAGLAACLVLASALASAVPGTARGDVWSVAPFLASNETSPKWSPDGLQLAFISDVSGKPQVFIANADGTGAWQVTDDPQGASDPIWSPDSQYLLYGQAQPIGQPRDLMKVKLASDRRSAEDSWNTTNGSGAFASQHARFSPGGQMIAAGWSNGGSLTLKVLANSDAEAYPGDWVQVGQAGSSNHPAWSPDGSIIAYPRASGAYAASEVWTVQPDGTDALLRIDDPVTKEHIWSLAWSPDGEYIAFSNEYDPQGYVGIAKADWSEVRILDTSAGFCHQEYSWQADIWSPDGQSIVYSHYEGGNWNIYTIDLDGTNRTLVTGSAGNDLYARFARDGRIAFQTDVNGNWDVFVATPEPATVCLLGLGGLALMPHRRRSRAVLR